MPSQDKVALVNELSDYFKNAPSLAVTNYSGLTVEKVTLLRKELRERKIRFLVAKNTLLRIAARQAGIDKLDKYFTGPTAVAFGTADPAPLAKTLFDFGKENEKPEIKALYVDGRLYLGPDTERIAKLPGREVLLAQLVGSITAPLQSLVGTLDGVIRKLVGTLEAMKDKQSG